MWFDRLFPVFWLLCLLSVSWLTPPLMAPDEPAHLMRAAQLAGGEIVGRTFEDKAGGVIDGAIGQLWLAFIDYQKPGGPAPPPEAYRAARLVHWRGEAWKADFRNTVQYGPLPYLPQALGLRIGKLTGLDLLDSYYLARGSATLTALALGIWALSLSGWIRPLGRVALLLPMSLFLAAGSVAQDGILISLGLLVAAIVGRAIDRDRAPEPALYAVAALAVATLAMARQPYLALAALFLLKPMRGRGAVLALVFIGLAFAGWMAATAEVRAVPAFPPGKDVDLHRQLAWLFADPWHAWDLARTTLGSRPIVTFYWQSLVGNLGLLSLLLAPWAYDCALWAVGGGWLAGGFAVRHLRPFDILTAWLALGAAVGGVFLGLYLTWTEVGAPQVEGVQGRYFLPLIGFLPLLLPARPAPVVKRLFAAVALIAALPPLYSMIQVLSAAYR